MTNGPITQGRDPVRRLSIINGILTAVSTLLAITVVILGIFTHNSSQNISNATSSANQASSSAAVVASSAAVVQDTNTHLEQENQALKGATASLGVQVSGLSSQLAVASEAHVSNETTTSTVTTTIAATETGPSSATPTPGVTPSVYHRGSLEITLTSQDLDLDTPQSDPRWGRLGDSPSKREQVAFEGFDAHSLVVNAQYELEPAGSNYSTCVNAPNPVSGGSIPISTLDPKAKPSDPDICVLTDQGRWALIVVKSVDLTTSVLEIDVTVWNNS